MAHIPELFNGTCRQFLFSPDGGIDGVLLTIKGRTVQVSLPPDIGVAVSRMTAPGRRLRLLAVPDEAVAAGAATHPVHVFASFCDAAGRPVESVSATLQGDEIKGVVSSLHFGPHGVPNGVFLASGDLIHLGPQGMAALALAVGGKVRAVGQVRITLLGTRMMVATQVNGTDLPPI